MREIDARELLEWQVLEYIDPWGQTRDDWRFALLVHWVGAFIGVKKADGGYFDTKDFLLQFVPSEQPQQESDPQRIEEFFRVWAMAANAKFSGKAS